MVSIPACHAGDRGSIPRRGGEYFFHIFVLKECTDGASFQLDFSPQKG